MAYYWAPMGRDWALIAHYWAFMAHYYALTAYYCYACTIRFILACIEREARCIDAPAEGPRANLGLEITSGSEGRTLGAT